MPRTALGPAGTVHTAVQCDMCGTVPIEGVRYKSQALEDFDLCSSCHSSPAAAQHAPYLALGTAAAPPTAPPSSAAAAVAGAPRRQRQQTLEEFGIRQAPCQGAASGGDDGSGTSTSGSSAAEGTGTGRRSCKAAGGPNHQMLVDWVWRYFSTGNSGGSSSGAPSANADGSDGGSGDAGGNGAGGGGGGGEHDGAAAAAGCSSQDASRGADAAGAPSSSSAKRARLLNVVMTGKAPLYFQHQGHSRTIIGIERWQQPGGKPPLTNLLILDPGQSAAKLLEALRQQEGWQRLVKRGVGTLAADKYQLMHIVPGLATEEGERSALQRINPSEKWLPTGRVL